MSVRPQKYTHNVTYVKAEGGGRYSWEAYHYMCVLYSNRYVKNMECWSKTQVFYSLLFF